MSIVGVIQLILMLLQGTATALGKSGLANEAAGVEQAIASLQSVHGSLVTQAQVEQLKITPQW